MLNEKQSQMSEGIKRFYLNEIKYVKGLNPKYLSCCY